MIDPWNRPIRLTDRLLQQSWSSHPQLAANSSSPLPDPWGPRTEGWFCRGCVIPGPGTLWPRGPMHATWSSASLDYHNLLEKPCTVLLCPCAEVKHPNLNPGEPARLPFNRRKATMILRPPATDDNRWLTLLDNCAARKEGHSVKADENFKPIQRMDQWGEQSAVVWLNRIPLVVNTI